MYSSGRLRYKILERLPEAEYERVAEASTNFAMRHATRRDEIYPVFRELFRKDSQ